jgi:hypothetical protein
MKYTCALLTLLAACATPAPRPAPTVFPKPSEPGAFHAQVTDREPETRRYRIKPEEILADTSNPELRYSAGEEGSLGFAPVSPAGAAGAAARLIRESVMSESWDADRRRTVYVDGEELVVRHTPEVLERVELLIKTLKENRAALFTVITRIISVRPDELSFLEHLPTIRGGGLGGVVEASSLNKTPLRGVGGRSISAPNLTLYHAQKGTIRIASNFAYIAGYEKDGPVYDPKTSVEWSGFEITSKVLANGPGSDRRLLSLAVTARDLPGIPDVPAVRLENRLYEMPAAVERKIGGDFVLNRDQALVLLFPEVGALDGIAGRRSADSSPEPRLTLVLVELVRAE